MLKGGNLVSVSAPSRQYKEVESGSVNQSGVLMTNEEVKQRNDDETLKGREDPEETTSVCGNQGDKDANEVIQKNEALQGTSECVYHVAGDFTSQKNGTSILWWHCLAWVLCLLLSFFCLLLSSVLGTRWETYQEVVFRELLLKHSVFTVTSVCFCVRFNSSQLLLWAQALVFSLVSCIFFIHPAVVRCHLRCISNEYRHCAQTWRDYFIFQILAVAVTVSLWCRHRADFHSFPKMEDFELQFCSFGGADSQENLFRFQTNLCFEKVIARDVVRSTCFLFLL